MSFVKGLLRYIAWVMASAIGGWQLTYVIAVLPLNMPILVETFIRFCLSVTGAEYQGNPEDMATLALLFYWTIATLFVGAMLFLCYVTVRHYRAGKVPGQ